MARLWLAGVMSLEDRALRALDERQAAQAAAAAVRVEQHRQESEAWLIEQLGPWFK